MPTSITLSARISRQPDRGDPPEQLASSVQCNPVTGTSRSGWRCGSIQRISSVTGMGVGAVPQCAVLIISSLPQFRPLDARGQWAVALAERIQRHGATCDTTMSSTCSPARAAWSARWRHPAHDPRQTWRLATHAAAVDRIGPRPIRPAPIVRRGLGAALPPQLLQACPDRLEIIGGAGSAHVFLRQILLLSAAVAQIDQLLLYLLLLYLP